MANLNNDRNLFGINFNSLTDSLLNVQYKNIVIAPGEPRFITTDDGIYITTDDGIFIVTDE